MDCLDYSDYTVTNKNGRRNCKQFSLALQVTAQAPTGSAMSSVLFSTSASIRSEILN
jgi:hypothetical protein